MLIAATFVLIAAALALEFTTPKRSYRSRAMTEIASEIAEALTDVAAALCFDAATKYEGTAGEQRQIAAVMFHTCQKRFGGVKYDGRKIEDADVPALDAMWQKMIGGRKRL